MGEMTVYVVTLRRADGRERIEKIVATTEQSASNQALLRVKRALGESDWMVATVLPAY